MILLTVTRLCVASLEGKVLGLRKVFIPRRTHRLLQQSPRRCWQILRNIHQAHCLQARRLYTLRRISRLGRRLGTALCPRLSKSVSNFSARLLPMQEEWVLKRLTFRKGQTKGHKAPTIMEGRKY